jgi:hypothetical protein
MEKRSVPEAKSWIAMSHMCGEVSALRASFHENSACSSVAGRSALRAAIRCFFCSSVRNRAVSGERARTKNEKTPHTTVIRPSLQRLVKK